MKKIPVHHAAFQKFWDTVYYPKYKKSWAILILEEDQEIARFEMDSGLKIKHASLWNFIVKGDTTIYVQFKTKEDLTMFLLQWA